MRRSRPGSGLPRKKGRIPASFPGVILASASPRRQELLKKVVCGFEVVPSGIDEERFRDPDPVVFALRAAAAKAKAVGEKYPSRLVIAADTLVRLGEEIFGKPKNRREAKAVLRKLSGKKHMVITGVVLYRKSDRRMLAGHEMSWVTFKRLAPRTIENYLDKNDEYLDKAGSYAIQESGDTLVDKLEGDYDNVVGLPVHLLADLFSDFMRRGNR